ncbi:SDR family oxidoreductase [Psychrobium sp. nBUS_13]|uniref:SDR family oxidoreductase n=1 Tax=Psychrobium sp. nBUS_13 TaxID=3395319 RepID=UPI003EBAF925
MRKKVLLCGGTGMLGSTLYKELKSRYETRVHGNQKSSHCSADLTSFEQVELLLNEENPDIIINLVALTNVDECQSNLNLAYSLNVKVPQNLASWARKNNRKLIQISTDHIYNKKESLEQEVEIVNNYALTKLAGEAPVLAIGGVVLRTNFFGKSGVAGRESFSDWLISSFNCKVPIKLFSDVYFNPLSMKTLSESISIVLDNIVPGVYNVGSRDGTSKDIFARMIAKEAGLDHCFAKSTKFASMDLKAPRPLDMRMDVSKFENTYGVELPTLESEIKKVIINEL